MKQECGKSPKHQEAREEEEVEESQDRQEEEVFTHQPHEERPTSGRRQEGDIQVHSSVWQEAVLNRNIVNQEEVLHHLFQTEG